MDGGVMTGKVALMTGSSRVIGAGGGLRARRAACLPAAPRRGRPVPQAPDRLRVRGLRVCRRILASLVPGRARRRGWMFWLTWNVLSGS